jgi:hypothetical protein
MNAEIELEERNPKEHRLFHYTPKLEYLVDMLRHGLWPRFCEEDFEWLIGERVTLAFPMLCFCDIPLDAASTHRDRYGHYAVGFSKSLVEKLDLNPVWYVQPESSVGKHLGRNLQTKPRFKLEALHDHPLRAALAFIKPTVAFQNDRNASRAGTIEVFPADEELEWRHTPSALTEKWLQSDDRNFVKGDDHALSENYRLKIALDQIECVLVPNKEDATALESNFPALKGRVETWS